MPNILIEAMKSGLPIACSKSDPMTEFLKDGGFYFDPYSANSIYESLHSLINDPNTRMTKALLSKSYSNEYKWKKCAHETVEYLSTIKKNSN